MATPTHHILIRNELEVLLRTVEVLALAFTDAIDAPTSGVPLIGVAQVVTAPFDDETYLKKITIKISIIGAKSTVAKSAATIVFNGLKDKVIESSEIDAEGKVQSTATSLPVYEGITDDKSSIYSFVIQLTSVNL